MNHTTALEPTNDARIKARNIGGKPLRHAYVKKTCAGYQQQVSRCYLCTVTAALVDHHQFDIIVDNN